MKYLRRLLFPFSLLYGFVAAVRNFLYNKGIFRSYAFNVPVIAVGNLSTGGTGKTPHTEYLIRLLQQRYRIAVLSRGYKRKSKGFVLADDKSTAADLGDEPFQYHTKFPIVTVAVDANRKNGIEKLLELAKPEVILLDDAYQHRRVKAGFYILLTAYDDLYCDDMVLPAGNLREWACGAKRAECIIVTKCPDSLTIQQQKQIIRKLKPQEGQEVYFTAVGYDAGVHSASGEQPVALLQETPKILVAGIAKPAPFFAYLQREGDVALRYPDHHDFTPKEIEELTYKSTDKPVVTTEKDYMRLKGRLPDERLFYLPIRIKFLVNDDKFNKQILNYVGKSTRNS